MENLQSTYTTAQLGEKAKFLTYDELEEMAERIVVGSTGHGKIKGWFERFMNKLGWYRQSEWYLIDSSKFMRWPIYDREFNLIRSKIQVPEDCWVARSFARLLRFVRFRPNSAWKKHTYSTRGFAPQAKTFPCK